MSTANLHQHGSIDWRESIRRNQGRSRIVIGLFFLIYIAIGFLVDMYLSSSNYRIYGGQWYHPPLSQVAWWLITWQKTPVATLVCIGIALISLWVTYAKYDTIMLMGTDSRQITPDTAQSPEEKQLYNVIEEITIAAGMKYIPKVYIIEADYMNAFASGYSEKSAMMAITRGLMTKLTRSELQAVMSHELSHIRHGDIKLTLTASVLSNLMLIVIDLLFYNMIFSRDDRRDQRLVFIIMIVRFTLPIITILLMLYLSRTREYMADTGAVELMRDNRPMASALIKISDDHANHQEAYTQAYGRQAHEDVRRAAYIFDPAKMGLEPALSLNSLFSTHPSIADRLKALGFKTEEL